MQESDDKGNERMVPEVHRNDLIYGEHIVRYLFARQFVKGKRVLDVACGSGYGSAILASSGSTSVLGLDISLEAVEECRRSHGRPGLRFLSADAHSLPLTGESFDVVVSFETIEHLHEPDLFISEVRRVLAPRGLLIISSPNRGFYPEGNPYHVKEFTIDEFEGLLNGFKYRRILGQDNWIASAIVPEELLEDEAIIGAHPAQLGGATTRRPAQGLYLVGLCSDGQISEPETHVVISRVSETDFWFSEMQRRDQELADQRLVLTQQMEEVTLLREQLVQSESTVTLLREQLVQSESSLQLSAVHAEDLRMQLAAALVSFDSTGAEVNDLKIKLLEVMSERDRIAQALGRIQDSMAVRIIVSLRKRVVRVPMVRGLYLSLAGWLRKRFSRGQRSSRHR